MTESRLRLGQWIKQGGEATTKEEMVKVPGKSSESRMMH